MAPQIRMRLAKFKCPLEIATAAIFTISALAYATVLGVIYS
jgi:hypothetical protein